VGLKPRQRIAPGSFLPISVSSVARWLSGERSDLTLTVTSALARFLMLCQPSLPSNGYAGILFQLHAQKAVLAACLVTKGNEQAGSINLLVSGSN